jgi:two-component system, cell cycle response regulator
VTAVRAIVQHRPSGHASLVMPTSVTLAALGSLAAAQAGWLEPVGAVLAGVALAVALAWFSVIVRDNVRELAGSRDDSLTDALTGLRNRRSLVEDIEDALGSATLEHPTVLVLLDLDDFKTYNDSFGHPAGDRLLSELGAGLKGTVVGQGNAYRLGCDEFCALFTAPAKPAHHLAATAAAALGQSGRGFSITASHGLAVLPAEARSTETALQLADQRLYETKAGRGRSGTAEQVRDALVQALGERQPELRGRLDGVAALTRAVARALELSSDDIDVLVRAAELHDVGKVAVPEAILNKPGPLEEVEWAFVRQHTIVGERILSAAPALVPVAQLVRSSHERYNGSGYPDGLAGEDIPLGARIISVCDAYHAMTSARAYEDALQRDDALLELRRCAGTQFDPKVVESFCAMAAGLPAEPLGVTA